MRDRNGEISASTSDLRRFSESEAHFPFLTPSGGVKNEDLYRVFYHMLTVLSKENRGIIADLFPWPARGYDTSPTGSVAP